MKTEANEPACPSIVGRDGIYPQVGSESWQLPGLTKREEFAKAAMQGYMANEFTPHENPERIADYSVRCADALITALNKAE